MHLMPIATAAGRRIAIVRDGQALDLSRADASLPTELQALIAQGASGLATVKRAADAAPASAWVDASTLTPAYPIGDMHKIVCVGLNYALHAKEGGNAIPDYPAFFMRGRESMIAAGEAMVVPRVSWKLDYEAELMIVVGKTARHLTEANALDAVFGYTIFNDGSVRDYQRKGAQWTPGKNFDATGAVGPVVVTADALPAGAHGLKIATRLNGQTMQSSDTSDMIFTVQKVMMILSEFTTLKPGDLIALGTPSGVGYARTPPVFMKAGDVVEVEIEGIGVLRNPVAAEAVAA